jgi:imidazolonepropionase-like amidohydrolase
MLSQTGGHGAGLLPCGLALELFPTHPGAPSGLADGPEMVRRVVRQIIRAGADQIKVSTTGGVLSPSDDPRHSQFRPDELAVILAEANAVDIPVMAHAQGTAGIRAAVEAGVRSIEHGIYLDDETIALMVERGTWLVPTLVAPLEVLKAADRGAIRSVAMINKAKMVIDRHRQSVSRAIAAGVKIALGTDAAVGPHGQNLDELTQLVSCGMPPFQAWAAATSGGAELLRLGDQIGRIAPGFQADLVVVDGGPIEQVEHLPARVRETWRAGRRVYRRL